MTDDIQTVDDGDDVIAAFEVLKAATPPRFMADFGRMMLMYRKGSVHCFKHKDMRRSFGFDVATGEFSGIGDEGEITTVEEAYEWARS